MIRARIAKSTTLDRCRCRRPDQGAACGPARFSLGSRPTRPMGASRRGAGVVERGGFENRPSGYIILIYNNKIICLTYQQPTDNIVGMVTAISPRTRHNPTDIQTIRGYPPSLKLFRLEHQNTGMCVCTFAVDHLPESRNPPDAKISRTQKNLPSPGMRTVFWKRGHPGNGVRCPSPHMRKSSRSPNID